MPARAWTGCRVVPRSWSRDVTRSSDGRLFYRVGKAMMAAHDVAPDGHHFLMARRIGAGGGQLIAWVDWLGELGARLDKAKK